MIESVLIVVGVAACSMSNELWPIPSVQFSTIESSSAEDARPVVWQYRMASAAGLPSAVWHGTSGKRSGYYLVGLWGTAGAESTSMGAGALGLFDARESRIQYEQAAGSSITQLRGGDFNGDGIPDVAVVSAESILVYLGLGDGRYGVGVRVIQAESFGRSVLSDTVIESKDFDGDGVDDLVVSAPGASAVKIIFFKNGEVAREEAILLGGVSGGAIAVGDFDGDGITDVAAIIQRSVDEDPLRFGRETKAVSVLFGVKGGGFQLITYPVEERSCFSLVTGRFVSAGHDALALRCSGRIRLFAISGTRKLVEAARLEGIQDHFVADSLRRVDVDGDGIDDLVVLEELHTVQGKAAALWLIHLKAGGVVQRRTRLFGPEDSGGGSPIWIRSISGVRMDASGWAEIVGVGVRADLLARPPERVRIDGDRGEMPAGTLLVVNFGGSWGK